MTRSVKITIALMLLLFLLFFPKYAPWGTQVGVEEFSLAHFLFTLLFFVASQTLGIVHEGGHGVCYILPCPEILMIANGTIFQLLFPALIAAYYKRAGNIFASLIALFFAGFSLRYTAWYISTAHEGPIVSAEKSFLGVDGMHDFHYLLTRFGILEYEKWLSWSVGLAAYTIMGYAVITMLLHAFTSSAKR